MTVHLTTGTATRGIELTQKDGPQGTVHGFAHEDRQIDPRCPHQYTAHEHGAVVKEQSRGGRGQTGEGIQKRNDDRHIGAPNGHYKKDPVNQRQYKKEIDHRLGIGRSQDHPHNQQDLSEQESIGYQTLHGEADGLTTHLAVQLGHCENRTSKRDAADR